MTNYKEIIRLHSLGLNKTRIAESCGCARSTVITALHKAEENGLSWNAVKNLSSEEVTRKLYPATSMGQQYSMPDYEWVQKEMQKSGVTLSLLWVEYCERCRQNGELPYGKYNRGALFLNDRNRITYNELCRKCVHDCIIPPCSKAMLIIPTKYIHS